MNSAWKYTFKAWKDGVRCAIVSQLLCMWLGLTIWALGEENVPLGLPHSGLFQAANELFWPEKMMALPPCLGIVKGNYINKIASYKMTPSFFNNTYLICNYESELFFLKHFLAAVSHCIPRWKHYQSCSLCSGKVWLSE